MSPSLYLAELSRRVTAPPPRPWLSRINVRLKAVRCTGPSCAVPVTAPDKALTGDPAKPGSGPGPGHTRLPAREDKQGTPSPGNAAALPGPGGCLSQRRSYWPLPSHVVGREWI